MTEPSPRASRLALAAGVGAVAIVGGGGFLLGQRAANPPPAAVFAPPAPTPTPTPDTAARVLGRTELLALAASAADATARGAVVPTELRDAVGRSFSIAVPFGCEGPAEANSTAAMRWRYDDPAGALRLHVAPVAWSFADWGLDDLPGTGAVEGFWLARPWTGSEACLAARAPVAAMGVEPVTLPGQTLAIGHLFAADARQGRRDGKPYAAVLRMAPNAVRGEEGFRIRLTGRIVAAPGGGAAVCRQPGGPEQRPVCLIVTAPGDIAIENAATGETLATWPAGTVAAGD